MSAEQSQAVEDLMALAYKHSQLYYDWHNDAVRYKTFEAARAELRAAITTALAEAEARGMERSASMAENYDLGTIDGHGIAEFIRAVAAEVKP